MGGRREPTPASCPLTFMAHFMHINIPHINLNKLLLKKKTRKAGCWWRVLKACKRFQGQMTQLLASRAAGGVGEEKSSFLRMLENGLGQTFLIPGMITTASKEPWSPRTGEAVCWPKKAQSS